MESKELNNLVGKKHLIKRYIYFILAVFLLASSYNLFILPNNLVFGGVSGIAVMMKNLIDPSLFILIVNLSLLLISWFVLGKEKTMGTVVGVILYPLFIKITSNIEDIIVLENVDILLTALFAGFFSGVATGTILKNGFSTGGSDVAAQIISKIFKVSMGKAYIFVDGLIILFGGIYLGFMRVMYAIIILYIHSLMADKIILGISDNKAFYIITDKEEEVKK
ncbi:MAG: YitT family protein, partial [Bacilli bacterium]|nr:YitT family protein [Bacilli bacterium]